MSKTFYPRYSVLVGSRRKLETSLCPNCSIETLYTHYWQYWLVPGVSWKPVCAHIITDILPSLLSTGWFQANIVTLKQTGWLKKGSYKYTYLPSSQSKSWKCIHQNQAWLTVVWLTYTCISCSTHYLNCMTSHLYHCLCSKTFITSFKSLK